MEVYKVLLPLNVNEPFDYVFSGDLQRGDLVNVPFRGGSKMGVVWGKGQSEVEDFKIKKIEEKVDAPSLPNKLLEFVEWVSDYNMSGIGNVLKMCLSVKFGGRRDAPPALPEKYHSAKLSEIQANAAGDLRAKVASNNFSATLLDGVTGSGKTEVYFEAIDEALQSGKQVLVMLPEIALSVQWLERFKKRFGIEPGVWHSERTPAKRRETWLDVAEGKQKIIVGARSALFLPFQNLGLVIVDEEHDGSYKQDEGTVYHGRDMAVARAAHEKFPIILASATPSLETVNNVHDKKYDILHLPERFGDAVLPKIEIADMRAEKIPADEFLSGHLRGEIEKALEKNQQVALYLNRRGYAPLTLCRSCGHRLECPSCSAWLVHHQHSNSLQCHHCGHSEPMVVSCPSCGEEDALHPCGPGVERIFEEASKVFPDASVEVISSDSPKETKEVIERMGRHEIDILIGTQIIAKGHHFPRLSLVGVVDADLGLEGGDLRAMERTYQLLHQVSGRAGRESEPGKVVIQTYQPENAVVENLKKGDRENFTNSQLAERKKHSMPPYGRLATVTVSGKIEKKVQAGIGEMAYKAPRAEDIALIGPAPSPMSFLRGMHRHRIILKSSKKVNLQKYIEQMLGNVKLHSSLKVKVDIDPYSFV